MRNALVRAAVVTALIVAAVVLAPDAWAQGRGRIAPEVEQLRQGLLLQGPGSEIGVSVRELRSDELSGDRTAGVYVEEVRTDGPASRAGLRAGDVVVEFDGERVRSVRQFTRLVRETPPGRAVKTTVIRSGSRQTLDVTPQESRQLSMVLPDIGREIEREMRALPREFDFDLRLAPGRLGVSLSPLSDQLASYFGVKEGVLVSTVDADSPAAQAGARAGDVITAVGGRTVQDPADVIRAIREAASGSALEIRLVREKKEMTVKASLPERTNRTNRAPRPIRTI